MALIDINKNSLPEQVQENKEKIADLESTTATKTYVDDQDAATLQDAKDYTDGKFPITAANVDSETATSGQVLTADGNGDAAWANIPTPEITAANVDSETATSGQVLTADGNGDAAWTTISAGGLTLLWSGSFSGIIGQITEGIIKNAHQNYDYVLVDYTIGTNSNQKNSAIIPLRKTSGTSYYPIMIETDVYSSLTIGIQEIAYTIVSTPEGLALSPNSLSISTTVSRTSNISNFKIINVYGVK